MNKKVINEIVCRFFQNEETFNDIKELEKHCEYPIAKYVYSLCLLEGIKVRKNTQKGQTLLTEAIKEGAGEICFLLASIYCYLGCGEATIAFLIKSSENNNEKAKNAINLLKEHLKIN